MPRTPRAPRPLAETFPGVRSPTTDFKSVVTDLRTTPLYVDVDLSTARSLRAAPQTHLVLPLAGNVLYIDQVKNSGAATLHFQDEVSVGSTPFSVFAGFLARLPFTNLVIENAAQPGLILRIIYGVDLDFVPAVSPGSGVVSFIDGSKARTLADVAFAVFGGSGAVAANFCHAQLWNPPGSLVNVIVEQTVIAAPATSGLYIGYNAVALTTLNSQQPKSKYVDAAVLGSTAQSRNQQIASATFGGVWFGTTLAAGIPYLWAPRSPVILTPGFGMVVINTTVNTDLSANFDFYEEGII